MRKILKVVYSLHVWIHFATSLSHDHPFLCLNNSSNRGLIFLKGGSFLFFFFLDNPEFYKVLSYIEPIFIWSFYLKTVLAHGRSTNITLGTCFDIYFSSYSFLQFLYFSFLFVWYFTYMNFKLKRKTKWNFLLFTK